MEEIMRRIILACALACILGVPAKAQEKVSFPSTDGDLKGGTPTTITGYLYKPAGAGPFAAVVSLPGCDGVLGESDDVLGKKGEIHPLYGQWGEILSRAGYIILLVDSFQPRGQGGQCGITGAGILREVTRDAFGGMNYLRSRRDVRPDSIALLGHSYGGGATLYTMSKNALPLLALPKAPEKDFRTAIVFYPGGCPFLLGRNPLTNQTNTHWRPRQPMLFLIGEADNYTPAATCKEVIVQAKEQGGPPIDTHFYPDAHHGFDHPNLPTTVVTNVKLPPDGHSPTIGSNAEARADAINRVTQFLSKQLQ
jgi:dienelactone hydrolase